MLTADYSNWKPIPTNIHPIFANDLWNTGALVDFETAQIAHRRIQRALSLATSFITVDTCLDWWCTLMFGEKKAKQKGSDVRVKFLDHVEPTAGALQRVQDNFLAMTARLQ